MELVKNLQSNKFSLIVDWGRRLVFWHPIDKDIDENKDFFSVYARGCLVSDYRYLKFGCNRVPLKKIKLDELVFLFLKMEVAYAL